MHVAEEGFFFFHPVNSLFYFVPLVYTFIIACYFEENSHK